MSVLSFFFDLIFGKSEPEKKYKTYDQTPSYRPTPPPASEPKPRPRSKQARRTIPVIDSSAFDASVKAVYPRVIHDTLALCEGIPDNIRQDIERAICSIPAVDFGSLKKSSDQFAARLSSFEWHWKEYEYWRDYYLKHRIKTTHMFDPRPEKLNLSVERAKYQQDKVFNLMTLKVAKDRLANFPEAASMKKADLIDFLKSNKKAWSAVIDPHVKAKWESKKHYEGETNEKIVWLLFQTINDRARALANNANETLDRDKKMYDIAKADPNCPWRHEYGHPVPGGMIL